MSFLGTAIELADVMVLYNSTTGRYVSFSKEGYAQPGPPLMARLQRLGLWGESVDIADWYPHRSRRVLLFPQNKVLWHPMPQQRTAGGFGYRALQLTLEEMKLWRCFDGTRTVHDIAADERVAPSDIRSFCLRLTHIEVQALQFHTRTLPLGHRSLLQVLAPPRPRYGRDEHMYDEHGGTTLNVFHETIASGEAHFDDVETSLAHCFAMPHPALSMEPYGSRLYRVLNKEIPPTGLLVEIGAGTGELALAWRSQDQSHRYVRVDASPALLALQNRLLPGTEGIRGDARELPFLSGSVNIVLCNEVIADLEAVSFAQAEEKMTQYGLSKLPKGARYNLGAWRLLEEIARVLAPGGLAYVSEFGDIDEIPVETEQLNHPEVSIHFGHLHGVATALGLQARLVPIPDLLNFDMHQLWLSRHSYDALRARMRMEHRHLQARAWSKETLKLPWEVEGLDWVRVCEPGPGPLPQRFWALLLKKRAV